MWGEEWLMSLFRERPSASILASLRERRRESTLERWGWWKSEDDGRDNYCIRVLLPGRDFEYLIKLQKIGFKKGHEAGFVEGDRHGFHRGLKKVVNFCFIDLVVKDFRVTENTWLIIIWSSCIYYRFWVEVMSGKLVIIKIYNCCRDSSTVTPKDSSMDSRRDTRLDSRRFNIEFNGFAREICDYRVSASARIAFRSSRIKWLKRRRNAEEDAIERAVPPRKRRGQLQYNISIFR